MKTTNVSFIAKFNIEELRAKCRTHCLVRHFLFSTTKLFLSFRVFMNITTDMTVERRRCLHNYDLFGSYDGLRELITAFCGYLDLLTFALGRYKVTRFTPL